MIRVNLSTLVHAKAGQHQVVSFDLDKFSIVDLELKSLKGEVSFTRVSYGILTEGTLKAEVSVECIRCLDSFYTPITIVLEDTISLPGADLTAERPVRVSEEGWADLSPLVREYAWIELPANPLCAVDCKGLCHTCGGNLNLGQCTCDDRASVDPRWEILRSLLDSPEK